MPAAILLAAGMGTRMRSALPKAMHPLGGQPMLRHLLAAVEQVFDRIVVVVGPGMEGLAKIAAPHDVVVQHERLGTAHAARMAAPLLADYAGEVAVLYADNPLITAATMRRLLEAPADIALLAMRPADAAKYGRVVSEGARLRPL
jgi:bifunctional UDP-N-acetylglucosamine pyrophosphorylase/glucosamine-1-phosphate N-acetyltransferase